MIYEPENKEFEGSVVLEDISKFNRLKYISDCNFRIGKNGEVEAGMSNIESMLKMFSIAEKHVKKVNLKHKSGKAFKTWKQVIDSPLCDAFIDDLAMKFIAGSSMGGA